jgi:hypothetical protein
MIDEEKFEPYDAIATSGQKNRVENRGTEPGR